MRIRGRETDKSWGTRELADDREGRVTGRGGLSGLCLGGGEVGWAQLGNLGKTPFSSIGRGRASLSTPPVCRRSVDDCKDFIELGGYWRKWEGWEP